MTDSVFLDTNYFIDTIHRRPERKILDSLLNHVVYISPLSFHIYCYLFKIKLPNNKVAKQRKKFRIVDLTKAVLNSALEGPTQDLEDNIQLHSAAEAECDYFLTNDRGLLKMKFFGKTKIIEAIA